MANRKNRIAYQRDCVHAANPLAIVPNLHVGRARGRFVIIHYNWNLQPDFGIGAEEVLQSRSEPILDEARIGAQPHQTFSVCTEYVRGAEAKPLETVADDMKIGFPGIRQTYRPG